MGRKIAKLQENIKEIFLKPLYGELIDLQRPAENYGQMKKILDKGDQFGI